MIEETGKKLMTACPTRWSYTLLALERLLELKPCIARIADENETIDNLRKADWIDIENYVKLMKPFADATYSVEGQNYTTISEVIPQLVELKKHLKDVSIFILYF